MDRMRNSGGTGVLSCLPSSMYRWIEECRVLDGPSVHDVVTGEHQLAPSIIRAMMNDVYISL